MKKNIQLWTILVVLAESLYSAPAFSQSVAAIAYIKVGVVNPINQAYEELTRGTGFVIDKSGHILTAKHVVQWKQAEIPGPRKLTVALGFSEASPVSAREIECGAKDVDICLIKISETAAESLGVKTPYQVSCRQLVKLEAISARGFPFDPGTDMLEVPGRINGAINSQLKYPTNVPIVPGMSGGPVLDSKGLVVALNSGGALNFPTLTYLQPLFYGRSLIEAAGGTCGGDAEPSIPNPEETTPTKTQLAATIVLPREVTELRYGRVVANDATLRLLSGDKAESGRAGAAGAAGVPGQHAGASGGPGGRGTDGENGSNGIAANKLLLSASELSGKLTIDARGQAGGDGGIGGAGGAGGAGARGDAASSGAFDCRRGPGRGGNGGAGGNGGDGGAGGKGGRGGTVEVRVGKLLPGTAIEILNGAGVAGVAGSGGTPGNGGSGGAEGSADGWCRPAGRDGANGARGASGRDGLPGQPEGAGDILLVVGDQRIPGSGRLTFTEPLKRF